jgi:hypothetical protein
MVKAKRMMRTWAVLLLGAGMAWAGQDVEMQIEWNGSLGTLTVQGVLADPAGGNVGVLFYEDFESGGKNWDIENDVWEIGRSRIVPPSPVSDGNCAGTILNGNYPWDTDSRLISPPVTLPTVAEDERIELRYWQWYSYYGNNNNDAGYVQVSLSDSDQWDTVMNPTGTRTPQTIQCESGWSLVAVDLTAYAGLTVRIAFYHTAEDILTSSGWYIDDVEIWKGVPTFVNPETFESGWGDWHTDNGVWQIGRSQIVPPSPVSGGNCAGTILNGDYPWDTDSRLISPPVTLPTVAGDKRIELQYWQWYSYYGNNNNDAGYVQVSLWDGDKWGEWRDVNCPSGTCASETEGHASNWSLVGVDLTAYAGQRVQIAFYHTAEDIFTSSGWYIDDVEILPLPLVLTGWSLFEDTGVRSDDKLTNDTTPTLTFVFSRPVQGVNSDIQITDPNGIVVVPDSISGWDTNTVTVIFATPLVTDGQYTVMLKETIRDAQGTPLNNGEGEIVSFILDTNGPAVTVDALTTWDTTPPLTGTISDPDAAVEVTVDGWDYWNYAAQNNRDGTWTLPDNKISPPLTLGVHQVVAFATDGAGNVGFDAAIDKLFITGLRIAYRQMQYDPHKGQCSVEVFVTNTASEPATGTFWLVVKAISEPSVTLANADGETPEGDPYVNLTPLLGDGQFDPNETVVAKPTFDNPQQKHFTATVAVRTMP